jgi:aldehyde dehydrogenase (NAD+)
MNAIELQPSDVEAMLTEHKVFFDTQTTKSVNFRIEQLNKLRTGIEKYESRIFAAIKMDLRKPEFESYTTEIGLVYNSIEDSMRNLKKWAMPKNVRTPIYLFPAKSFVMSEPYGTVLVIGPYNYPFQLLIEPLVGVIAAGNCAVLKPSEVSPNVSAIVTEMISDVFDSNYIRSVEGNVETNTSLINAAFDYIFFTGSVAVGKIVMAAAAKNLVPVTLELGGKSPVIVDESADIKVAAQRIIWGKMLNAGQTCVAPDYLMVHETIKEELIDEMKNVIREFFGADPQKSDSLGRIINNKHFNRIKNIIELDQAGIVYGGRYDEEAKYIEPTLIEVASWNAASMGEEIFGPVLPFITYNNLDKAIKEIKKLPKPLAMYLFTTNKAVEEKVLNEVSSGGACINDTITHLANPHLPFGGVGNSGMGSYHGYDSFLTFSHRKSVLKRGTKININLLFPPYGKKKLNAVKRFMGFAKILMRLPF